MFSHRPERDFKIGSTDRLFSDVSEALGIVPTVRLNKISRFCKKHACYLKLEACNPGGSIKEKNAAYLIKNAEQRGLLKPGSTIVESSSGNFGIGLAMIGAARGYRVIIVVDAKTAPPMRRILKAYGAELVDVPLTEADLNGSMQIARMNRASQIATAISNCWYPCQHKNPLNPNAHYEFTAPEIISDFGGTPPDALVVGVSTAGQLSGLSRYFRRFYPNVTIVGVDVSGSIIFNTPPHPYKMTGIGLSFVPPNYNPKQLDVAYMINDRLAFSFCRALAKSEGLLLGASTGAIVAAGLAFAAHAPEKKKILMINPDHGNRYLETVFNDEWIENQGLSLLKESELDDAISVLEPIPAPILYGTNTP